ncbi:MAG: hypothetical protein V7603_6791 [Micromonosporaceae bacterium]
MGSGRQAFWIDQEYDREHADRYRTAVRQGIAGFTDAFGDIAPVTFACTAWRLATPPVRDPGYVRWHRRVLRAQYLRNPWDGGLSAEVTLVSPWPGALTWSREWWRDRGWRDWPEVFGQFTHPADQDLARGPHLRASLLVQAPLPVDGLPPAPDGPDADVEGDAARAVTVLVHHLNELLTPVVRQLEYGEPPVPEGGVT